LSRIASSPFDSDAAIAPQHPGLHSKSISALATGASTSDLAATRTPITATNPTFLIITTSATALMNDFYSRSRCSGWDQN
jgi:hypothetical protein